MVLLLAFALGQFVARKCALSCCLAEWVGCERGLLAHCFTCLIQQAQQQEAQQAQQQALPTQRAQQQAAQQEEEAQHEIQERQLMLAQAQQELTTSRAENQVLQTELITVQTNLTTSEARCATLQTQLTDSQVCCAALQGQLQVEKVHIPNAILLVTISCHQTGRHCIAWPNRRELRRDLPSSCRIHQLPWFRWTRLV